MDSSLSIVLPVHNAQTTLAAQVDRLLEILPEIASYFEILIIDDGSTDETDEVAHELTQRYPQVRVRRHPFRQGHQASVRTGLMETRGDVIFVQEDGHQASAEQLRKLWQMRNDAMLVMAQATAPPRSISPRLLDRLQAWGMMLRDAAEQQPGSLQMIRRRAVEEMDEVQSTPDQADVQFFHHGPQSPRSTFHKTVEEAALISTDQR